MKRKTFQTIYVFALCKIVIQNAPFRGVCNFALIGSQTTPRGTQVLVLVPRLIFPFGPVQPELWEPGLQPKRHTPQLKQHNLF